MLLFISSLTFLLSRSQWVHIFNKPVTAIELFSTLCVGATACLISCLRRTSSLVFGQQKNKTYISVDAVWMALSSSLCSLRHRGRGKCSAVSCCSLTAEYRPLRLIHLVNKSGLARVTRSAANRRAKTESWQPMAALGSPGGGAKREETESL